MSTILVVEDDLPNRTLIALQLEDLECEIHTAENGLKGLERVRSSSPDVVVLDLNMPGLDGFGFLKQIRAAGSTVPVVVLTAMFLDRATCDLLRSQGVVRILEKGRYDEDDLVTCLQGVLAGG